ncbi:unnamed protein product, partial [Ectocarpus fasciculatus]
LLCPRPRYALSCAFRCRRRRDRQPIRRIGFPSCCSLHRRRGFGSGAGSGLARRRRSTSLDSAGPCLRAAAHGPTAPPGGPRTPACRCRRHHCCLRRRCRRHRRRPCVCCCCWRYRCCPRGRRRSRRCPRRRLCYEGGERNRPRCRY